MYNRSMRSTKKKIVFITKPQKKLMDAGHDHCGQMASIYGQFHSYNFRGRRRLKLFLFAHEIDFSGGEPTENRVDNEIIQKKSCVRSRYTGRHHWKGKLLMYFWR